MLGKSLIILIVISWVINLPVIWWASKYLKFKRSQFKFAFLVTTLLFVSSSIIALIFYLISSSTIVRVIFSLLINFPLWIYIVMKIYRISLKKAIKAFLFVALVGGLIYLFLLIIFSISGAIPETSCEEKFSSPLNLFIEDKEGFLIRCYSQQAMQKRDENICDNTQDNTVKEGCYLILAEKNGDVDICDNKVKDPTNKENCYLKVAIANGNQELCIKIVSNSQWNYNCYLFIARNKLDPSICYNLPESGPYNRYSCELDINTERAVLENNPIYCDTLEVQWKKNYCYSYFARATLDENFCYKMRDEEPGDNSIENCIENVRRIAK